MVLFLNSVFDELNCFTWRDTDWELYNVAVVKRYITIDYSLSPLLRYSVEWWWCVSCPKADLCDDMQGATDLPGIWHEQGWFDDPSHAGNWHEGWLKTAHITYANIRKFIYRPSPLLDQLQINDQTYPENRTRDLWDDIPSICH